MNKISALIQKENREEPIRIWYTQNSCESSAIALDFLHRYTYNSSHWLK
mgnify:CR=1 FL=1|jgi:hypothetical protein